MPEGPSILILKEALADYDGKRVLSASGNTKALDPGTLKNKTVHFSSWGKHFLMNFGDFTIRIHFLMFGSYAINERKDRDPRLQLKFRGGELNFYNCSVKLITEPLDEVYDWSTDVLNENWDAAKAKKKILKKPARMVCDVLLDQDIFAGVGNIIKNEVLFRVKVHPASKIKDLPAAKLNALIKEAVNYSYDFLRWKKEYTLRQHWLVYRKTQCPDCGGRVTNQHMGKTDRRTFFCPHCQKLYK